MLYQVDPSGSYFPWKATAIGKSATSAKTFLEKRYTEGLELEDAVHIALLTLKETIEGEMNGDTVEIGELHPAAAFVHVAGLTDLRRHCRSSGRRPLRLRGCRRRTGTALPQAQPAGDRGLPYEPMILYRLMPRGRYDCTIEQMHRGQMDRKMMP